MQSVNDIGNLRVLCLILTAQDVPRVAIESAKHPQAIELGLEDPVVIIEGPRHQGTLHQGLALGHSGGLQGSSTEQEI
jgi:hypothetical protein